jgi:hypothetical protein
MPPAYGGLDSSTPSYETARATHVRAVDVIPIEILTANAYDADVA